MTPTQRFLLLGAALVLVLGALAFLVLPGRGTAPAGTGASTARTPGLPVAPGVPAASGVSASPVPTMTIAALSGGAVVTKDFIHNGTTTEDPQSRGNYYLAGAIGYCLKDGTCPSGAPSDEYHVVYAARDQAFYIALLKEPLGEARLDAEQFLLQTLGVPRAELCSLKYFLSTTSDVNSLYAGENLLFSFCPGAVRLPQ